MAVSPPIVRRTMSWGIWNVVRLMMKGLLLTLTRWQRSNNETPMPEGPMILVCNHLSWIDAFVLMPCLSRRISFMAKMDERLFTLPRNMLFRSLGAFSPSRGRQRRAYQVLGMDRAIGIFPEGLSNSCARLRRGNRGAAHIALHTGAPILPVAITGTEKLKHINIFRRPEITVTIGQPFYLSAPKGRVTSARLSEATDSIMTHIAALLPESYRGVYSDHTESL